MAPASVPRKSPSIAMAYCLLNWLIPGAGYVACGDHKRGWLLFLLINGTFLVGIAYGGYVVQPQWWFREPDFNLVTLLTYLVEAFHGGGWLSLQFLHALYTGNEAGLFNLQHMAIKPYSDLGIFHIVVAGGLNYFATMRLYDLMAGAPELTETLKKPASGGVEATKS